MYKDVNYEVSEKGIALLTLNRPQSMNSFSLNLIREVIDVCGKVNANDAVKALVVTGSGKGFSSGGDITLLGAMDSASNAKKTYDWSSAVVRAVYDVEKPVIAAINGPVAGAATALMMACDLIIASENARFGFNFAGIAFCPDSGCSYFLVKKVGYHRAAEILFFARLLNSEEASRLGLVNKVVPSEECLPEATRWAERLAEGPGLAIKLDKKLLRQAEKFDMYQMAEMESMYQILTWASDDFREGCTAFLEKRKPDFKGK